MKIFLDTNFIVNLNLKTEFTEKAKAIIEAYIEEELITSVTVVEETLFVLKMITRKSNKEVSEKVLDFLYGLDVDILETLPLRDFLHVFQTYNLLPNDALIAATCKHYGITKIATFDEDFKRVDFLEVVEP